VKFIARFWWIRSSLPWNECCGFSKFIAVAMVGVLFWSLSILKYVSDMHLSNKYSEIGFFRELKHSLACE
jgi:hypothetical protein